MNKARCETCGSLLSANDPIKSKRKASGLSQYQLAEKSDVSRNRIGLHEQGHLELRPEEIERISKALGDACAL